MALEMTRISGFSVVEQLHALSERGRHSLSAHSNCLLVSRLVPAAHAWRQLGTQSRYLKSAQGKGMVGTLQGKTRLPLASASASTAPGLEATKPEEARPASVRAGLTYAEVPGGEKPYLYLYQPSSGAKLRNTEDEMHEVDITDVRHLAHTLDIDRQGFQLVPLHTALSYDDFSNEAKIKEVYYAEAAEAVKKATGASRVVVFDHTFRKRDKRLVGKIMDMDKLRKTPQPVDKVHVDYTEKSGPQRMRDFMGDEADTLFQKRFAIVQVWRALKGPVIDAPLAVCDASTMASNDLIAVDLIYKDRVGEINYVAYNPAHKWYYVRRMTTDESLVFKCYDSDRSKVARFTPHTGFYDPTTPPDAAPRESIEIRTLAFWD